MQERDIGAVEQDVRGDVGRFDALPEEGHVDDAERGDGAFVGQFDLLARRQSVGRTCTARRNVDLGTMVCSPADQLALRQSAEVEAFLVGRRVVELQPDRRGDHGHRLGSRCYGIAFAGSLGFAGIEAGDVEDRPRSLFCPPNVDPHTGTHTLGRACVDGVKYGRIGPVELYEGPGERVFQWLTVDRFGRPGPGFHRPDRLDIDEVGQRFVGDGVELGWWNENTSVAAANTDDATIPQPGEKAADGRTDGPRVVELHVQWGSERLVALVDVVNIWCRTVHNGHEVE